MYIVGISAFYHDSAACIIKDGILIAAAQEERFTRKKFDPQFPSESLKYCIKEANINADQIENVVFYEKPFLKFERLLETYLAFAPRGLSSFSKSMPLWIKDKLFQKSLLVKELKKIFGNKINWKDKILFSEHHLSHAASAFYPSPFQKAAILSLDGVGEWSSTSLAVGEGRNLDIIKEIRFPHSLGLLYSAFTYYIGFKVNSGEYKVMGLAPYGKPIYASLIKDNLINIGSDGSFQLDMSYFDYATGLTMTNEKFNLLFEGAPREIDSPLTQREMDLAASVQKVTEEIVIKLAKSVAIETGLENLCLAGGVALNCVANGLLVSENLFKNVWVQPAAGDAGGALGAALSIWHIHYNKERTISKKMDGMHGSYLGPKYTKDEIENDLKKCGAHYKKLNDDELIDTVTKSICDGKVVGWVQGRMEFGPRALGSRSIIADPRLSDMQKQLNLKVKYRESFRPFAPSILREYVHDWFDQDMDSPYMLFVSKLKKERRIKMSKAQEKLFGIDKLNVPRSSIPAVTHVDYSARVQTVHKETNSRFYDLLNNFFMKTGCPVLINTSFNVRGEPIVCSPIDAFKCFMSTELDLLAIGNFVLLKEDQ